MNSDQVFLLSGSIERGRVRWDGRNDPFNGLGKVKVPEDEVAVLLDVDVLRAEIAVDDRGGMEVLQAQQHLGGVETGAERR